MQKKSVVGEAGERNGRVTGDVTFSLSAIKTNNGVKDVGVFDSSWPVKSDDFNGEKCGKCSRILVESKGIVNEIYYCRKKIRRVRRNC